MLNLWRDEQKKSLGLDQFEIIRRKDELFIIVSKALISGKNLEFRFRAGAKDKQGKNVINGDLSSYFPVN